MQINICIVPRMMQGHLLRLVVKEGDMAKLD